MNAKEVIVTEYIDTLDEDNVTEEMGELKEDEIDA